VNNLKISGIALAIGFAFGTGALAQGMSESDYKAAKDAIASEYKSTQARCASLSGNSNDICMARARGGESSARAELDATYRPGAKSRHDAQVAKAQADYAVAKERCDDVAGNTKDVCVKEAQAAQTIAKAAAKAQLKTSQANATANDKSTVAHRRADDEAAYANREAADDKRDAQYGVAKQQCDAYAGNAKELCLDKAKASFAKP
jgi:hypothetical protein